MYPSVGHEPAFHHADGKLAAVSLGADACSEHEWGIGLLRAAFGSPVPARYPNGPLCAPYEHWKRLRDERKSGLLGAFRSDPPLPPMGLERRKLHSIPAGFGWVKATAGEIEGFGYYRGFERPGWDQSRVDQFAELPSQKDKELTGAWSDESFIVLGRSDLAIKRLMNLFHAIHDKDAVMTIGGGLFVGSGLAISVASLLPTTITAKWLADDQTSFEGDKKFDETGVEELLRSKGKDWFALGDYKVGHDGQWRAWLNPYDQQRYSAGAFTVEELRLWAEDKGPVVKTAKQRKRR